MDLDSIKGLSPDEKLELLALLEIRDRRHRENMLASYKPYEKQKEFHAAGADHRERLFMAANQCSGLWSWVETPDAKVLTAEAFFSEGARVRAWAGGSECVAQVRRGFLRGIEPAFRLVTDTGAYFDCSANHQVLTESGWLSLDRIVSLSSGQRCWHTTASFQASCVAYGYLDDPQLPWEAGSGPARLLAPGDAPRRSLCFSLQDAEERTRRCTSASLPSDLQTSAGGEGLRLSALCAEFAGPAMRRSVLPLTDEHRALLQLALESSSASRSGREPLAPDAAGTTQASLSAGSCGAAGTPEPARTTGPDGSRFLDDLPLGSSTAALSQDGLRLAIFFPREGPSLVGGARIVAVVPIGFQPIVDCEVPGPNNYRAAGIYHHNCGKTLAAAYEIAMHATGRYPDWWPGRRFHRPVSILIGSETAELTRKGLQRLLLGSPQKREEWGTGAIPKDCLGNTSLKAGVPDAVASVTVKNEYGGDSVIQFNSYDQGRTRWQADTIDVVAMDEEPPLDIYSEALTRTNATGGLVFVTFTPLLGMTQVVKRFLMEKPAGTHVTRMTIDDVDHYTPEERAKIVAAYPEHEREARAKGIPIMGSGLVFPVAESSITVAPFEIPPHWGRICGIDFGWGHPSAFVCIAHDRETDTAYVYDAWKLKETPVMTQAGIVIGKGYQNLPWAWPHDGLQHDKGSGEVLRDQYKKFGLNMLAERAQFENLPDGRPGGNSLEAGVAMMLERMQTRRLRIFSHLEDWFNEFRLYHRKDGIIVKLDDDVISATRYGLMMLRKAKSLHELEPVRRSMMPQAANVPKFEVFDPAVNY